MKQKLAKAFHYGSWLLLTSLVLQFFFAGVMLFGVARLGSTPHIVMALFIHGLSFALFVAAIVRKIRSSRHHCIWRILCSDVRPGWINPYGQYIASVHGLAPG